MSQNSVWRMLDTEAVRCETMAQGLACVRASSWLPSVSAMTDGAPRSSSASDSASLISSSSLLDSVSPSSPTTGQWTLFHWFLRCCTQAHISATSAEIPARALLTCLQCQLLMQTVCEGVQDTCGLCADVGIVRQLCRRCLDLLGILAGLRGYPTSILQGSLQIEWGCSSQDAWQGKPFLNGFALWKRCRSGPGHWERHSRLQLQASWYSQRGICSAGGMHFLLRVTRAETPCRPCKFMK